MTNKQLIQKATDVVKTKKVQGGLIGDVGCALLSAKGKLYFGVCVSTGSNVLCAEKNAIGSMLTAGEYKIKMIVAVWKDLKGDVYVIPPCGNCRQFIKEVDLTNLHTNVVLDADKTVKLKELLPYNDSWMKQ
ncbi:hypothetical protein A3D69_03100 [Candidatus Uhrbacteria bacterium RIFCSPHIGHO2_02_FULL_54_11]|nr:MAG: hypothetical protein A3D69_03100 [Candidatus Uhrbacteria bacterium RIFCSPHIGHO2_02_FULL_54_11]